MNEIVSKPPLRIRFVNGKLLGVGGISESRLIPQTLRLFRFWKIDSPLSRCESRPTGFVDRHLLNCWQQNINRT